MLQVVCRLVGAVRHGIFWAALMQPGVRRAWCALSV